jgi:hypothetical protein
MGPSMLLFWPILRNGRLTRVFVHKKIEGWLGPDFSVL